MDEESASNVILNRVILYSVLWGVGAYLLDIPDIKNDFSEFICT